MITLGDCITIIIVVILVYVMTYVHIVTSGLFDLYRGKVSCSTTTYIHVAAIIFSYLADIPCNGSFQASLLFIGSWRIGCDNDFSIFAVYGKGMCYV